MCLLVDTSDAKVTLPSIISQNMVLQQQAKVNIWGKAAPNEKITLKASWTQKVYTTEADENADKNAQSLYRTVARYRRRKSNPYP
jgi:hypothetical protein